MKILLTGATGFLGRQIVNFFVQENHQLIISCRDKTKLSLFPPKILDNIGIWDMASTTIDEVIGSNPDIDAIVHAATDYGRTEHEPTTVFWTNEVFPMTLLEKAVINKIPTFINLDTFFNNKESKYKYLGAYSLSKRHFQEWAQYYGEKGCIKIINLKIFHIFGPQDDNKKYVPTLIAHCLTGKAIDHTEGTQQRDFIYSEDVVRAISLVLNTSLPLGYHHYDVGRGEVIKLRDFAQLINRLCGDKAIINFGALPMRPGEPMHACANINALCSLGWSPQVSLPAGLAKIIEEQQSWDFGK